LDIATTLKNMDLWATEKEEHGAPMKVEWQEQTLFHSNRERYSSDSRELVKWIPFTNRRRGIMEPDRPGHFLSPWKTECGTWTRVLTGKEGYRHVS
jgi:hypothetical protein